jgi:lysozyme
MTMTVLGVDISKWDGNWDAVRSKAAGAEFAFIKASQATYTDPLFVTNWQRAKDAGILRSAYHYLDYGKPGRDQANYFADLLAAERGELIPTVDFEQRGTSVTAAIALAALRDFAAQMKARGFERFIIYTSVSYWKEFGEKNASWAQFPLWLADYNNKEGAASPAPWTQWTFWQFTPKGSGETFGTESFNVDVNRYNGSLDDLYAFAGTKPVATTTLEQRLAALEQRIATLEQRAGTQVVSLPVTPAPGTGSASGANASATCTAQALNVRSGPGASYPVIGWLSNGQKVKVLERQNGWARIETPSGWSGERYLRFS